MSIWNLLERILLNETKQYRGATGVTFKALIELIQGKGERPGILGRPPRPEGEAFDCEYKFDPSVWGNWSSSARTAVDAASTGGNQHVGAPQGSTTMKKNYGGRISHVAGKPKSDFEALPSSMDRYDVLMRAEVTEETVPDKKTRTMKVIKRGVMLRMAYAPSIGRTEERAARLQAMMDGRSPTALTRRPQPERPGVVRDPTKQDPDSDDPYWHDKVRASVPDAPRVGTDGRMGLGHKQRDTYRKTRDEED